MATEFASLLEDWRTEAGYDGKGSRRERNQVSGVWLEIFWGEKAGKDRMKRNITQTRRISPDTTRQGSDE